MIANIIAVIMGMYATIIMSNKKPKIRRVFGLYLISDMILVFTMILIGEWSLVLMYGFYSILAIRTLYNQREKK